MGLARWLSDAVATVSKSLTGRKRKAPDERQEEEDEEEGLLPPPPPPSNVRVPVKSQQQQQRLGSRGPQRLNFSSPAMDGPQWGTGQEPRGVPAGGNTLQLTEKDAGQAGHNHLGPGGAARRLDDMLGAAVKGTATALSEGQQGLPGMPAAAPVAGAAGSQPFSKLFMQPRMPAQPHGISSCQLLNGLRHVRQAPSSHAKLGLTPSMQQQQQPLQQPLGQVQGMFTGGRVASTPQGQQQNQQEQQRRCQPLHGMHQQQRRLPGADHQLPGTTARHTSDELLTNSQDAALLRRAVEVNLRQEELHQQQQHQQPTNARVEEVDLTAEPSSSQHALQLQDKQAQQQLVVAAVGPAMATVAALSMAAGLGLHLRDMLRQVVLQDDEMSELGGSDVAALDGLPTSGEHRYQELKAEAQLASRRALQAQEQEIQFVQQAHTALEHAQPQWAQQLEAEAQKIEKQLQELQLQRQQQQPAGLDVERCGREKEQQEKEAAADLEKVAQQSSSEGEEEEEEEAEASASMPARDTQSEEEQEESEVSQQLEQIRLEEGSVPLTIPDEWREEYTAALALGPAGEVLVDHSRSSIQVSRKDMRCMAPAQWLNDEVINLYISLLLERDALWRKQGKGPRCHFFSTFFANKLYKDTGYSYDQVRRWTLSKRLSAAGQASKSILDCDRVVVPVHQGLHWVCAVIDLQQRKLVYYDSLKGEDHRCLEQLARYLRDEFLNKRNQQRDDVLDWPREFPKRIPQQLNGCDCGVFTLLFANYVGRAAPLAFSQAHIDDFRVRIVHELLQLRVD